MTRDLEKKKEWRKTKNKKHLQVDDECCWKVENFETINNKKNMILTKQSEATLIIINSLTRKRPNLSKSGNVFQILRS